MTRFAFRLQRLLGLRVQEEREKARDLGLAIGVEEARRLAREQAEAQLARMSEQVSATAVVMNSAGALVNLNRTILSAAVRLESADEEHRCSEDALTERREEYGEARRDRRAIERYRERCSEEFEAGAVRRERAEMDEVARQRWLTRGES